MLESSLKGQKTLWEKEKLLVTSNLSFSYSVFNRLVLQTRRNKGFFGKELSPLFSIALLILFTHFFQGLKTAKEVEALVYSETSAKTSEKSVKDVIEVAALSALGSKQHHKGQNMKRQKSFIKKKRFSGMGEAKTTLRKEATKSCAIM